LPDAAGSRERWAWIAAGVGTVGRRAAGRARRDHSRDGPSADAILDLFAEGGEGDDVVAAHVASTAAPSPSSHRPAGVSDRFWVRPLESIEPVHLDGTEGVNRPFWSPDSRYLAYFTGDQLKKIPVSGGPPQLVCEAQFGAEWVVVLLPGP